MADFSAAAPSRRMLLIILAAVLVLAAVGGFRYAVYLQAREEKQAVLEQQQAAEQAEPIAVHVVGAVEQPGLYWLPPRSRVIDALQAAGGAQQQADLLLINLAAFLTDGSQLVVPYVLPPLTADADVDDADDVGDVDVADADAADAADAAAVEAAARAEAERVNAIFAASGSSVKSVPTPGGTTSLTAEQAQAAAGPLININTADSAQLQTLSGIGEVKAQAIIDYRQNNGDFAVIEHITRVSGIGPATFESIKDKICVQ